MIVEGIRKTDSPKLQQKAFEIAEKWVLSNYFVYTKTSNMWEKYNVNGSYPDAGSGGKEKILLNNLLKTKSFF
jgi:alpha,alpha-trehalase